MTIINSITRLAGLEALLKNAVELDKMLSKNKALKKSLLPKENEYLSVAIDQVQFYLELAINSANEEVLNNTYELHYNNSTIYGTKDELKEHFHLIKKDELKNISIHLYENPIPVCSGLVPVKYFIFGY